MPRWQIFQYSADHIFIRNNVQGKYESANMVFASQNYDISVSLLLTVFIQLTHTCFVIFSYSGAPYNNVKCSVNNETAIKSFTTSWNPYNRIRQLIRVDGHVSLANRVCVINRLWRHQQSINIASKIPRYVKIVILIIVYGLITPCKKQDNVCTVVTNCLYAQSKNSLGFIFRRGIAWLGK